jgi:hypothetical protein
VLLLTQVAIAVVLNPWQLPVKAKAPAHTEYLMQARLRPAALGHFSFAWPWQWFCLVLRATHDRCTRFEGAQNGDEP